MKRYGLTGGIGAGKSTAAKILERHGVPVIDTDQIARDIVEPGQPALAEVAREFGRTVLDEERRLRRDALAQIVFSDPTRRTALESILHPRIRAVWVAQLQAWQAQGHPAAVVVIPLLFETAAQSEFDAVICVACSAPLQRERLRARGWSNEEIGSRLQSQWPIDRKIAASNYVVWSEGHVAIHERQLALIFGW